MRLLNSQWMNGKRQELKKINMFSGLKKIPIKKSRSDKGKKGSHPNQSMWHRTRTDAEKKAYSDKISAGMKRFYAQRKAEDAEKKSLRIKASKKIFFESPEGREEKEYRRYLTGQYMSSISKEELEKISAKKGASRKKEWDTHTPEERRRIACGQSGLDMTKIFEFNVPRKKNFCGVVREDRMYG